MAKEKKENLRHALVARLKNVLGEKATAKLVEACRPDQLEKLKPGQDLPTVAELLVDKIVRFALDKDKANQWAVDLVFGYIEGRPVQGLPKRDDGRHLEDHLNDITRQHLNSLAATIDGNGPAVPTASATEDPTPGPTTRLLVLPGHRIGSPKEDPAKSPLEIRAPAASG